jgi:sugar-specific transcriptional regulator TrmB
MESSQQTLLAYLESIGLSHAASQAYMALYKMGPSSALQLSRQARLSRTQTYRCLEELEKQTLVSSEQLSYGTIYTALSMANIEGLLSSREAETVKLKGELNSMMSLAQSLIGASKENEAATFHYHGIAGIKQVNWNLTKADKEYFVLEMSHITDHFDETFGRRHRERQLERGLVSHDLTNSKSVTAKELMPVDLNKTHYRHIDPKILTINYELYIYNDVVTLIDYDIESSWAIEIHHAGLNIMMRQIYAALWSLGKPIKISR